MLHFSTVNYSNNCMSKFTNKFGLYFWIFLPELLHITKGWRPNKKTVKWVTSNIFQITPSLLTLRMTTKRMTNHNNQWVPPSLRKEWQINVLKRFQRGQRDLHFGWFYSNIFHFPWNKEWGMRFGQKREFSFPKS